MVGWTSYCGSVTFLYWIGLGQVLVLRPTKVCGVRRFFCLPRRQLDDSRPFRLYLFRLEMLALAFQVHDWENHVGADILQSPRTSRRGIGDLRSLFHTAHL